MQKVANPAGTARERANILTYAALQNRHHALTVEVAPFTMTQLSFAPPFNRPTQGYVLRSSGSYCGKVDEQENSAGRMLVAFYLDKDLQHSLMRGPTNNYGTSEPLIARGKFYVMGIDTRPLLGGWYPSATWF